MNHVINADEMYDQRCTIYIYGRYTNRVKISCMPRTTNHEETRYRYPNDKQVSTFYVPVLYVKTLSISFLSLSIYIIRN